MLKELHDEDRLIPRKVSKLAIVYQTSIYVKEAFGLNIDTDSVKNYLIRLIHKSNAEASRAYVLVDTLMQEIIKNTSHYTPRVINTADGYVEEIVNANGSYKYKKGSKEVELKILRSVADEILERNNISNIKQTLKELKSKGVLICENDRLTKRCRINDDVPAVICYYFKFSEDFLMIDADIKETDSEDIQATTYTEVTTSTVNNEHYDSKSVVTVTSTSSVEITESNEPQKRSPVLVTKNRPYKESTLDDLLDEDD